MTQVVFTCSIIYLLILIICLISVFADQNDGAQDRLYHHLFATYRRSLIPVCADSPLPINVSFQIKLRQLISVDENDEVLNMKAFVTEFWYDCRLRWDPANWSNLTQFLVPATNVWTPDIMLYDGIEDLMIKDSLEHYVIVQNTGYMLFYFPGVIKTPCKLNVEKFPFDNQECNLTFGSWSFSDNEVQIVKSPYGVDYFKENNQWNIIDVISTLKIYAFSLGNYTTQRYIIHLERRPFFYTLNILVPSALFTLITLVGFYLPSGCGEKMTLQITTLLSLSVFNTVIINQVPANSDVPFIAINFLVGMFIVTMACAMTVVVLDIHFSNHARPLPRALRRLMAGKFIGRMMCCFQKRARNWLRLRSSDLGTWITRRLTLTRGKDDKKAKYGTNMPQPNQTAQRSSNEFEGDISNSHCGLNIKADKENEGTAVDRNCSYNPNTPVSRLDSYAEFQKHTREKTRNFNLEWQLFAIFVDRLFMYITAAMLIGVNVFVYLKIINWDKLWKK